MTSVLDSLTATADAATAAIRAYASWRDMLLERGIVTDGLASALDLRIAAAVVEAST